MTLRRRRQRERRESDPTGSGPRQLQVLTWGLCRVPGPGPCSERRLALSRRRPRARPSAPVLGACPQSTCVPRHALIAERSALHRDMWSEPWEILSDKSDGTWLGAMVLSACRFPGPLPSPRVTQESLDALLVLPRKITEGPAVQVERAEAQNGKEGGTRGGSYFHTQTSTPQSVS